MSINSPKCCICEYVADAFGNYVECKKTAENGKHMFVDWYYWNDGAPAECPLNTEKEEVEKNDCG